MNIRSLGNSALLQLCAGVAELADALDSGSSGRKAVQVQVLSPAPFKSLFYCAKVIAKKSPRIFRL